MWATDTTQKSKSWEFVLPDPDSPGIGPDSPDPAARSLRMSDPERKVLLVRSFRAYTRSLRVTLTQRLVFRWRGINTPPYPFSHNSCKIYELNTHPSKKRALTLPFLHSWVIPLGDLSESQARARIRASEPHSHLLSTWFWSSTRISSLLLLEPCAPRWLGVLVIAQPRLWGTQEVCKLQSSPTNP